MKYLGALVLLAALATPAAAQNQTTFRNSQGQTTGTATRDSNGTTTFLDGSAGLPAPPPRTATAPPPSATRRAKPPARPPRGADDEQASLPFSFSSRGSAARGGLDMARSETDRAISRQDRRVVQRPVGH